MSKEKMDQPSVADMERRKNFDLIDANFGLTSQEDSAKFQDKISREQEQANLSQRLEKRIADSKQRITELASENMSETEKADRLEELQDMIEESEKQLADIYQQADQKKSSKNPFKKLFKQ